MLGQLDRDADRRRLRDQRGQVGQRPVLGGGRLPRAAPQQADDVAQLVQGLAAGAAQLLGRGAGRLVRRPDAQRARLQHHERHPVRDDVVHLGGEPGAFLRAGPLGEQVPLALGALGPLGEALHDAAARDHVHADQRGARDDGDAAEHERVHAAGLGGGEAAHRRVGQDVVQAADRDEQRGDRQPPDPDGRPPSRGNAIAAYAASGAVGGHHTGAPSEWSARTWSSAPGAASSVSQNSAAIPAVIHATVIGARRRNSRASAGTIAGASEAPPCQRTMEPGPVTVHTVRQAPASTTTTSAATSRGRPSGKIHARTGRGDRMSTPYATVPAPRPLRKSRPRAVRRVRTRRSALPPARRRGLESAA